MADSPLDHPIIEEARRIADEVFFPAANEVDATGEIPGGHFDLLAENGFYGLPAGSGGEGVGFAHIVEILELLSGGCLSTTFTWMQHNGAVMSLVGTDNGALRDRYLNALVAGTQRAGAAFAGALPTPPRLWASETEDGYVLDGDAPFVSGWGLIDLVQLSARDRSAEEGGGFVVSGLIEAQAGEHLTVQPLDLAAGAATRTVRLVFDGYPLTRDRITSAAPLPEFLSVQSFGSRLNGCVACGLTRRIARLLGEAGHTETAELLTGRLTEVRELLDRGLMDPEALTTARASASALALRAAGALVAVTGSTSILAGGTAQRLLREAGFVEVAASRPDMRAELASQLVS